MRATPPELLDVIFTGGAYSVDKACAVIGWAPQDSCLDALVGVYAWKYGM